MFVLMTKGLDDSKRYYNGRAAHWDGNLTTKLENAFKYHHYDVAQNRAYQFNSMTKVHGLTFEVEELNTESKKGLTG